MIVDVIDTGDIEEAPTVPEKLKTLGYWGSRVYGAFFRRQAAFNEAYRGIVPTEEVRLILMPPVAHGVALMITYITTSAGRPNTVRLLRITGHGGPGWGMKVSSGHDMRGYVDGSALTALTGTDAKTRRAFTNVWMLRPQLDRLTPYFTADARVELRGCRVAADERSRHLLAALRDIWGVTVQAGEGVQYGGANWSGPVWEAPREGGAPRRVDGTVYSHLLPGMTSAGKR